MVKVQLTDEDMAERNSNKYFDEGLHEVLIKKAERGTTDSGKDYVEFTVLGSEDQEGTARLWFTTEKAAKYALSIMAGIAVHNKKDDIAKEKARQSFKAITDTDLVDNKFLNGFKDMDAWYLVELSDRTYVANDGTTKHSYDRNIYGYAPNPKKQTAEQLIADYEKNQGAPVDPDEIPFA